MVERKRRQTKEAPANEFEGGEQDLMEKVRKEVDLQVADTLRYYASKPAMFKVEDGRQDGNGTVKVSVNWEGDGKNGHFDQAQVVNYADGRVIKMIGDALSEDYFECDSEHGVLRMAVENTTMIGNQLNHKLAVAINGNGIGILEERSRVGGESLVNVLYRPQMEGDNLVFKSQEINLSYHQESFLPEADAEKILPGGRVIKMQDVVAMVVDPFRAQGNYSFKHRVPALDRVEGFIKLDWGTTGHAIKWIHEYNRRKKEIMLGNYHPLKNDPDGWLALVNYRDRRGKTHARAITERIDRDSIKTEDIKGVATIKVRMTVEGQEFDLVIPEDKGGWKEVTEQNKRKLKKKHFSNGKKYGWEQINAEELKESIKKGYYIDDILTAGLKGYLKSEQEKKSFPQAPESQADEDQTA
jgi:hypothetical protein